MKKIITLFTGLTIITFLVVGTTMNAETVKITRPINGITNITLASYGDLVITQGNKNSLTIETTKKNENNLIFKKEGKTLILKTKNNDNFISNFWGFFDSSNNSLTYNITLKNINEINSKGSGNITSKGNISSKNLTFKLLGSGNVNMVNINASNVNLTCSGSGNVNIESLIVKDNIKIKLAGSSNVKIDSLNTDSLNSSVFGSGNITISSGSANSQHSSVMGSGNYSASGFKTDTTNIEITGSGSAAVNTKKTISISVAGSGNLNVTGKPKVSSITTSGSGSVKFKN